VCPSTHPQEGVLAAVRVSLSFLIRRCEEVKGEGEGRIKREVLVSSPGCAKAEG